MSEGKKIFGDLLPLIKSRELVANAATTVSFSTDVDFGGVNVKVGTYSVFTILEKANGKMMLNTDLGKRSYKVENTVAEVTTKSLESNFRETMIFLFDNVKR